MHSILNKDIPLSVQDAQDPSFLDTHVQVKLRHLNENSIFGLQVINKLEQNILTLLCT